MFGGSFFPRGKNVPNFPPMFALKELKTCLYSVAFCVISVVAPHFLYHCK